MVAARGITIEGFAPSELLSLSAEDFDRLVLTGKPVTFVCGTAEILGRFRVDGTRLHVELGHIDSGGEGVLLTLWNLCVQFARMRRLSEIDWLVHAVHCANPNLKLRRVLTKRGFSITRTDDGADVYRMLYSVEQRTST